MNVLDLTSHLLLLGIVVAAVMMDFKNMRISNRLILTGCMVSLVLRVGQDGASAVFPYLWNTLFPVITLYLFYLIGVLGAGDVKLFSVIGGFVNFKVLISCMAVAFLVGALLSLGKLVFFGKPKEQLLAGGMYLLSLLKGRQGRYPRDRNNTQNLIHFSLSILIGLLISIYFPLW